MKKFVICLMVCLTLTGCSKKQEKVENYEEIEEGVEEIVDVSDIYSAELNNMMCDWYDEAGNLVWEGISPDDMEKLTKKQKENFLSWWEEYQNSFYDTDSDEVLVISGSARPRDKMSALCREYNNLIPFSVDGREYGLGYEKYYEGFDNRTWKKNFNVSFGLDGEGYIIWLYRNTFGTTPEGMEDGINTMLQRSDVEKVEISALEVGDICMLSDDPAAPYNLYGVVAGTYDNHIVVSLCDNVSTPKFSDGCTRLAYIVDDYNVAIGESMPVDFKHFMRITSLNWGD